MRLDSIRSQKESYAGIIQPMWPVEVSDSTFYKFRIFYRDPLKRVIGRKLVGLLHPFINFNAKRRCPVKIPFPYTSLLIGERWSLDISLSKLLACINHDKTPKDILIAGCGRGGEDVQFWLRHGPHRVQGIDICYDKRWDTEILPAIKKNFKQDVTFVPATVEKLPLKDESFDLVTSNSLLEHVLNPELAVKEIHRVTKTGGYSWHSFGPLYFSYAGDHGISSYGHEHGYDHLLKDEAEYRKMISDKDHFGREDKDIFFLSWALRDQFSFYTPGEYIDLFKKYFSIEGLILIISPEGLLFRKKYPALWEKLTRAGLQEADLLIKSVIVTLRKTRP